MSELVEDYWHASVCSCPTPQTIWKDRRASGHSSRNCSNWVGRLAAMCESWWAGANANDIRRHAEELAALAPDELCYMIVTKRGLEMLQNAMKKLQRVR